MQDIDTHDEAVAQGISVLIVEDEEIFSYALSRALETEPGIGPVSTAATVSEGVAAARRTRPDVVLMDYRLPDANGVEAARAVRKETPDSRVVILSAFADEEILHEALDAGCSGYVVKSGLMDELLLAVRAAHAGDTLVSPSLTTSLLAAARSRSDVPDLTSREREVLSYLAAGAANREIAAELHLSVNTVRSHVQNLLSKLDAHTRLEAVAVARRTGLL